MREINQKIIGTSEKTYAEFVEKNKAFFEKIRSEETRQEMKKELCGKQRSFGNKDKQFKKSIAEKWGDSRLTQL
jgi:hypothetical protein